ncbi:MAG: hypothetical protein QM784_27020 [Polyangiaceae bacterium]
MNVGPLGFLALLMGVSCSVDASERCAEGRTWNSEYKGCLAPTETAGTSAGGGASAGESGSAGQTSGGSNGGTQTGTSPPKNNLGSSCAEDVDCSDGTASVCLLDPNAPKSPGVCTVPQCVSADCGTAFRCCDCTQSPVLASTWKVSVCAPVSKVEQLTSPAVKCTCE